MKTCSKCRQIKTLRDFSKNCTQKDGYCHYCKSCVSEYLKVYQKTEPGKISGKRYAQSKKGRAAQKRASIRYYQTERGKNFRKINSRKFRIRHPNRIQATIAANEAIRIGKLSRPDALICILCWGQAKEYHHPSYEMEHQLDVIPVCKICHAKIHKQFRKEAK